MPVLELQLHHSRREDSTCRKRRPSNGPKRMRGKANRRARKLGSSFARRWITFAKANTGHGQPSRPLPSGSRRRGVRAYSLNRPRKARRPSGLVDRRNVTPRKAAVRSGGPPRQKGRGRPAGHSSGKGTGLRRAQPYPGMRIVPLSSAVLQTDGRPPGKRFAPRAGPAFAAQLVKRRARGRAGGEQSLPPTFAPQKAAIDSARPRQKEPDRSNWRWPSAGLSHR